VDGGIEASGLATDNSQPSVLYFQFRFIFRLYADVSGCGKSRWQRRLGWEYF